MKHLSIRTKITLWFSAALIIVVVLTYIAILSVSNQVIQKTIRDNLIETVEDNVDEVEYFSSIDDIDLATDVDYFLNWGNGFLEVDDDFLDEVNQVYTSLYQSDGTLLYGENPIAMESADIGFSDSSLQKIYVGNTLYYIFDRELTKDGLDGLWLRGVVSEVQGEVQLGNIARASLILLPSLVLVAIIGGYLIARRMMRPLQKISDSAEEIREGGDLKKRIEIGDGSDELHKLADNFNEMFDRLETSFQTERQFTSDASHELRTPMSVIMAQCELSLELDQDPEEYREALEVIQRQGKKMSRLINDMLDFTRLELKSDRYVKETIDLTALIDSLCTDMALIRENGITLDWKTEPGINIQGNRELLSRLLTNLVSNAYRYGKENGHIFVDLKTKDGAAILSVRDDGIGISAEDQQKIFGRFYQSDNSRTGEGTGLGLSMVQEIARFHGGNVAVESEVGKGSTFICSFPACSILP